MRRLVLIGASALAACQPKSVSSALDQLNNRLASEEAAKLPSEKKSDAEAARASWQGLQQQIVGNQELTERQKRAEAVQQVSQAMMTQAVQNANPPQVDVYVHQVP